MSADLEQKDMIAIESAVMDCEGNVALLSLAIDDVFSSLPPEDASGCRVYRLTVSHVRAIIQARNNLEASVSALSEALYVPGRIDTI